MEKDQLARELRLRLYTNGILDDRVIAALSNDQIIDTYIICADRDEKLVDEELLYVAIAFANNMDEFLVCCERLACARTSARSALRGLRWPEEREGETAAALVEGL